MTDNEKPFKFMEEFIMNEEKKFRTAVIGGVAIVVIGVGALLSFSTIPANSVGIKYNKFSGVQEDTYS